MAHHDRHRTIGAFSHMDLTGMDYLLYLLIDMLGRSGLQWMTHA